MKIKRRVIKACDYVMRHGTIGKFILQSKIEVDCIMWHDHKSTMKRKGIRCIPAWSTLSPDDQAELLSYEKGSAGSTLRERIFMIECNMMIRKPPYMPRDIWLAIYFDYNEAI